MKTSNLPAVEKPKSANESEGQRRRPIDPQILLEQKKLQLELQVKKKNEELKQKALLKKQQLKDSATSNPKNLKNESQLTLQTSQTSKEVNTNIQKENINPQNQAVEPRRSLMFESMSFSESLEPAMTGIDITKKGFHSEIDSERARIKEAIQGIKNARSSQILDLKDKNVEGERLEKVSDIRKSLRDPRLRESQQEFYKQSQNEPKDYSTDQKENTPSINLPSQDNKTKEVLRSSQGFKIRKSDLTRSSVQKAETGATQIKTSEMPADSLNPKLKSLMGAKPDREILGGASKIQLEIANQMKKFKMEEEKKKKSKEDAALQRRQEILRKIKNPVIATRESIKPIASQTTQASIIEDDKSIQDTSILKDVDQNVDESDKTHRSEFEDIEAPKSQKTIEEIRQSFSNDKQSHVSNDQELELSDLRDIDQSVEQETSHRKENEETEDKRMPSSSRESHRDENRKSYNIAQESQISHRPKPEHHDNEEIEEYAEENQVYQGEHMPEEAHEQYQEISDQRENQIEIEEQDQDQEDKEELEYSQGEELSSYVNNNQEEMPALPRSNEEKIDSRMSLQRESRAFEKYPERVDDDYHQEKEEVRQSQPTTYAQLHARNRKAQAQALEPEIEDKQSVRASYQHYEDENKYEHQPEHEHEHEEEKEQEQENEDENEDDYDEYEQEHEHEQEHEPEQEYEDKDKDENEHEYEQEQEQQPEPFYQQSYDEIQKSTNFDSNYQNDVNELEKTNQLSFLTFGRRDLQGREMNINTVNALDNFWKNRTDPDYSFKASSELEKKTSKQNEPYQKEPSDDGGYSKQWAKESKTRINRYGDELEEERYAEYDPYQHQQEQVSQVKYEEPNEDEDQYEEKEQEHFEQVDIPKNVQEESWQKSPDREFYENRKANQKNVSEKPYSIDSRQSKRKQEVSQPNKEDFWYHEEDEFEKYKKDENFIPTIVESKTRDKPVRVRKAWGESRNEDVPIKNLGGVPEEKEVISQTATEKPKEEPNLNVENKLITFNEPEDEAARQKKMKKFENFMQRRQESEQRMKEKKKEKESKNTTNKLQGEDLSLVHISDYEDTPIEPKPSREKNLKEKKSVQEQPILRQNTPEMHHGKFRVPSANIANQNKYARKDFMEEPKSFEISAKSHKSEMKTTAAPTNIFHTPKPTTAGKKEFSRASNKQNIKNAITNACLAGEPNRKEREEVLSKLNEVRSDINFIIAFKAVSARLTLKALYTYDSLTDEIKRIYSNGTVPEVLDATMVENYYNYNNGPKEFKLIQGNKNFSLRVDAVSLYPQFFRKGAAQNLF